MFLERFKKKEKEFVPDIGQIEKVAINVVSRVNRGEDPRLAERLLFYAGVSTSAGVKFEVEESPKMKGCIDIVTGEGKSRKVAFTLGEGITSVFFINFDAIPDRLIQKFKKRDEIKNFDDLVKTIHGFIRLEPDPKAGEIKDISKAERERKMHENKHISDDDLSDLVDRIKNSKNSPKAV